VTTTILRECIIITLMSLPTSEPIPMPEDELPPARRRRMRRLVVPEAGDEQTDLLDEIGKSATPGAEFYISALLAGGVAGLGLLLDSPALVVLAALLAPFMAPMMGVPLATVAGSAAFFFRSLSSLVIGGVIFLLTGSLAGWAARLFPPGPMVQASSHLILGWPNLLLLTVGMVLSVVLMVRSAQQRPLVSSVAVAYAVYLPLSAAGFGLTSGLPLAWEGGLVVFLAHLIWAALAGTLTLVVLGLRPLRPLSYILTAGYVLACLTGALLFFLSSDAAVRVPVFPQVTLPAGLAVKPSITPKTPLETVAAEMTSEPTQTASPRPIGSLTPTRTLVPSGTPTITVTPAPTPVWARIAVKGGNGAYIRGEPKYDALIVASLLNGNIVEVMPDVMVNDGVTWAKVRTADNKEGWIVRSFLATATPAPGW
jgi:hypothetical protein